MLTTVETLHEKALNQLASLLASHESGRISAESFRVGVETIWACLGGVVDTPDFRELMHEANVEVQGLPIEPSVKVFENAGRLLTIVRRGEKVGLRSYRTNQPTRLATFDVDDNAIEYVGRVAQKMGNEGFKELDL